MLVCGRRLNEVLQAGGKNEVSLSPEEATGRGLDEGDGVWVTLAYRETEGILSGMSHVNKDM